MAAISTPSLRNCFTVARCGSTDELFCGGLGSANVSSTSFCSPPSEGSGASVSNPCSAAQARYRFTVCRCIPVARCTTRSLSLFRICSTNSRMSTVFFLLSGIVPPSFHLRVLPERILDVQELRRQPGTHWPTTAGTHSVSYTHL